MTHELALARVPMTEPEYRKARDAIRATYGDTAQAAGAQRDQALAVLFHRSGWTQVQLAKIEGMKQAYISYRLTFGRFLSFITSCDNPEFAPIRVQLTEGRFRAYWQRTDAQAKEHQRFIAVRDALLADMRLGRSTIPKKAIGEAIAATCADHKWHPFSTIVARVQAHGVPNATDEDVAAVLVLILARRTYGLVGQKRKGAKDEWQYKLTKAGRYIPLHALMVEVGPLLEKLAAEGKKSVATASPGTVATLTWELRQVLERLTTEKGHND